MKKDLYEAHGKDINQDEVDVLVEPQPDGHARQNARMMLGSIIEANAPCSLYRGFMTGEGNFRYNLATIQPYKGNRDESTRPVWLSVVRDFLVSECNGEVVTGIEADDRLVMEFVKDPKNTILCSIDKDFLTVEDMRMYNWRKKELIYVSPLDAKRNFYKQMLTGDQVDNVAGVPGIGEKGAEKLIDPMTDQKAMEYAVYYAFKKKYAAKAWDYFVETGRLLHLWRKENDLWEPIIKP